MPLRLQVYLSFIHYMQTDNGEFKNFMSYTKEATEEEARKIHLAERLWRLGF